MLPSPSSYKVILPDVSLKDSGNICSPNNFLGIEITPIRSSDPVGNILGNVRLV